MQRMNPIRPNWLMAAVLVSICASAAVATTPSGNRLPVADVATLPHAATVSLQAARPVQPTASPSKLDYVVLASLADSSSLLSMTSFRAGAVAVPNDK